jgi:hypothetical protein
LGVAAALVIGHVMADGGADAKTVDTVRLLRALARFARATQRSMVNLESPLLPQTLATNAHIAVDIHWALSAAVREPSSAFGTRVAQRVQGPVAAVLAAARELALATISRSFLFVVTDPNHAALRKATPNVPLTFAEQQTLPGSHRLTAADLAAISVAIAHNRGLVLKLCAWVHEQRRGAGNGSVDLVETVQLVSTCLSTSAARTAVFHRFDDELLLMDNVRAGDCPALLEVLQRTVLVPKEKRKPGAAPPQPARVADAIVDWLKVLDASFAAFSANLKWRSFLDEKKRMALMRAGSAKQRGSDGAGITADAIGGLGSENALARLGDGEANATAIAAARDRGDGDVYGSADGGDDVRSVHGGATVDARSETYSVREARSEGGYTHLSARTAATTTRGKAVVAAIENLQLDAKLQNAGGSDTNAHLPTVLLELFLAWATKAVEAFVAEFEPTRRIRRQARRLPKSRRPSFSSLSAASACSTDVRSSTPSRTVGSTAATALRLSRSHCWPRFSSQRSAPCRPSSRTKRHSRRQRPIRCARRCTPLFSGSSRSPRAGCRRTTRHSSRRGCCSRPARASLCSSAWFPTRCAIRCPPFSTPCRARCPQMSRPI